MPLAVTLVVRRDMNCSITTVYLKSCSQRGQESRSNISGDNVDSFDSSASLTPSSYFERTPGSEYDGLSPLQAFQPGEDSADDELPAFHSGGDGQGPPRQIGIAAPQARRHAAGGDDHGSISSDLESHTESESGASQAGQEQDDKEDGGEASS